MRAVFLDRDGVINKLVYYADRDEYESPRVAADFELLPDVLDALKALRAAGWALFLVSNQPSYAKGKTTLQALYDVHDRMEALLVQSGIQFEAFYYSYTHPDGVVPQYTGESAYRKPNPGFLLQAQADYDLDMAGCWMAGDRDSDIFCGQRAGCKTAQIAYIHSAPKRGQSQPDWQCADLPDFVRQLVMRKGQV